MLYLIGLIFSAPFWIGVVVGTVLGGMIKVVLKWAWNLIPLVPKIK